VINGNLEQFLDTGWYTEAELYYDGYVFWCEATTNSDTGNTEFFVDRWRADCDGEFYHQYIGTDGKLVDYSRVLSMNGTDMDDLKKRFLMSPIFCSKAFWEVQRDIVWAEQGADIRLTGKSK